MEEFIGKKIEGFKANPGSDDRRGEARILFMRNLSVVATFEVPLGREIGELVGILFDRLGVSSGVALVVWPLNRNFRHREFLGTRIPMDHSLANYPSYFQAGEETLVEVMVDDTPASVGVENAESLVDTSDSPDRFVTEVTSGLPISSFRLSDLVQITLPQRGRVWVLAARLDDFLQQNNLIRRGFTIVSSQEEEAPEAQDPPETQEEEEEEEDYSQFENEDFESPNVRPPSHDDLEEIDNAIGELPQGFLSARSIFEEVARVYDPQNEFQGGRVIPMAATFWHRYLDLALDRALGNEGVENRPDVEPAVDFVSVLTGPFNPSSLPAFGTVQNFATWRDLGVRSPSNLPAYGSLGMAAMEIYRPETAYYQRDEAGRILLVNIVGASAGPLTDMQRRNVLAHVISNPLSRMHIHYGMRRAVQLGDEETHRLLFLVERQRLQAVPEEIRTLDRALLYPNGNYNLRHFLSLISWNFDYEHTGIDETENLMSQFLTQEWANNFRSREDYLIALEAMMRAGYNTYYKGHYYHNYLARPFVVSSPDILSVLVRHYNMYDAPDHQYGTPLYSAVTHNNPLSVAILAPYTNFEDAGPHRNALAYVTQNPEEHVDERMILEMVARRRRNGNPENLDYEQVSALAAANPSTIWDTLGGGQRGISPRSLGILRISAGSPDRARFSLALITAATTPSRNNVRDIPAFRNVPAFEAVGPAGDDEARQSLLDLYYSDWVRHLLENEMPKAEMLAGLRRLAAAMHQTQTQSIHYRHYTSSLPGSLCVSRVSTAEAFKATLEQEPRIFAFDLMLAVRYGSGPQINALVTYMRAHYNDPVVDTTSRNMLDNSEQLRPLIEANGVKAAREAAIKKLNLQN